MRKLGILAAALTTFLSASAYDFEVDGIYYDITDTTAKTVAVTSSGVNDYGGNIALPSSVSYDNVQYTVTSIKSGVFSYCYGLTSIAIPNSVTLIESEVFPGCDNLTDIAVDIDNPAYSSNNGVLYDKSQANLICWPGGKTGEAVIPNTVTTIGWSSFSGCSGLTSIIIPNSVTSVGSHTFSGCSGLTSIALPNSVTTIGDYAFSGCSGLTSITIPNSETSIGEGTFSGCSGLTSIALPNSVTSIRNYTFSGCSGLTSITIPNTVASIGAGAFSGCSGLTSITFPNSVTTIGDYAFQGCSSLTSIAIPNSLSSIGMDTFYGCSGLTDIAVDVDNPAYSSYDGALYDKSQTNLICWPEGKTGEAIIPNTVTSIGESSFSDCDGLTSITLPNSVKTIEALAFENCSSLESVTIPNSVTSIGYYAFDSCSSLTSITSLAVTPPKCGEDVFYGIDPLKCTLYVPTGSKTKYQQALQWRNLAKIEGIVLASEIQLNETEVSIDEGSTFRLTAEILPADAAIKGLQWESSDESCVTVDADGLLMAISQGTATITVRSADGYAEATCLVKVMPTLGIEAVEADGGAVEVFNLTGVKIADSVDSLPAGIYLVHKGSAVRKVVVK